MSDRNCSVPECAKPYYGKGHCNTHYARWRKHGHIEPTRAAAGTRVKPQRKAKLPILERLMQDSEWRGDCLVWLGPTVKGYGRRRIGGKNWLIHRLAYTERHGPIPSGMVVMHRCDNPPCWTDGHLVLGTPADNNDDMMQKSRHWKFSKTHCIQGHEYTAATTIYYGGVRNCLICKRESRKKTTEQRRASRALPSNN